MARKAREKSATGFYHVVIRGADRQTIFEETTDYKNYLEMLQYYKEECHFDIFAYCLMTNHVHLVIRIGDVSLSTIFQRLNTKYALWFNVKYQRTGHLQQGRFYSEPVNDELHLMRAIRYVHRNPCKAGLEKCPGANYHWSSIYEYKEGTGKIVDSDFIYRNIAKTDFFTFNAMDIDDKFIDIDNVAYRITDDEAKKLMIQETQCENATQFQKLTLTERNQYIVHLHLLGLSVRQLNRITGVSRGIIDRVIQKHMHSTGTAIVTMGTDGKPEGQLS